MSLNQRPKTLFIDIDGVLFKHKQLYSRSHSEPIVLPGVLEKFYEWDVLGYNIILVTGRRESEREATEKQLSDAGIIYDKLIMGIGGGDRIIINDFKIDSKIPTAHAICIDRDNGLLEVNI
jgi:histidinol phosphatase-like enzyme